MPLTGPPVPSHHTGQSFRKFALDKLKQYEKSVLLIDESAGEVYTYKTILKMSTSIAVKLKKLGIKRNVVVASCMDNSVESLSTQLGILFAGGISNPVNQFMKADEIRTCIMICRPVVIFCDNKYLQVVEDSVKNIGWVITIITKHKGTQYLSCEDILDEDVSNFSVESDDPAEHVILALFTSGTTGVPKAVLVNDERTYMSSQLNIWEKRWRILLTSPMFWISNTFSINKALMHGKTVILPAKCNAEGVLKCMTNLKPDCWFTGPSVLIEMCSLPNLHEYDTTSMEAILIGGTYLSLTHKHMIRKRVFNERNVLYSAYGSTEVGFVSWFLNIIPPDSPEYDSTGQILSGISVKIIDHETQKELGPGDEGEICVKSRFFMNGYMNRELKNTEMDSDGWWYMGDMGYYDEKGFLYFTTRIKEIMKYRGVQISSAELEAILYKNPDVLEACVVSRPHDIDGDWPTAFVVKRPYSSLTEKELTTLVEDSVSDLKKLRGGVHFLPSLPKSAVGKILKDELKKMLL